VVDPLCRSALLFLTRRHAHQPDPKTAAARVRSVREMQTRLQADLDREIDSVRASASSSATITSSGATQSSKQQPKGAAGGASGSKQRQQVGGKQQPAGSKQQQLAAEAAAAAAAAAVGKQEGDKGGDKDGLNASSLYIERLGDLLKSTGPEVAAMQAALDDVTRRFK